MSTKARKPKKSVLSRQDIANRRKNLADQKLKTDGVARRALIGVFVGALSLLALLAVATFDPQDRQGPGFHNLIGPVGHGIAEGLRGLLGVCAYVLPAAGLYAAGLIVLGEKQRRWPQVVSLALLSVSGAVLAQLVFTDPTGFGHAPGGAVGEALGGTLSSLFSTVGTVILVTAVCVAALIVGTQFVFLRACSYAWAGITAGTAKAKVALGTAWVAQKEALQRQREARAKAKLEEAAFLAQLEADEEELLAAEREAAEAEAMAEEAEKLAREKENRRAAAAAARRAPQQLAARQVPLPPASADAPLAPAASLPPGDPAWAFALAPPPGAVPPPHALQAGDVNGVGAKKRERRTPNIVTPPGMGEPAQPPPLPAQVEAAQAQQAALADAAQAMVAQLGASSASLPPTAATAAAASGVGAVAIGPMSAATGPLAPSVPPPTQALARTPVIIEPKAPPKPTAKKKEQEQFEFVGDRKSFTLPPLEDVLEGERKERSALNKEAFLATAEKLRAKLADFNIAGEVVEIRPGPVVTMYEFLPAPGIKVAKIASLQDDLAMAMEAMAVRIVAPIPGKNVVGIEVPNKDREMVFLKEIAEQDTFNKSASRLTMCVGKDIEGMPYVLDLAKAPHLLIAGTTGSGKSVAVNAMIMSILLKSTPEEVRFIMVDPKMLELSIYEGIPHLLLPVVTDPKKAALALRWAVEEMERRYALLSDAGVRNIAGYNKLVESAGGEAKELLKSQDAQAKKKPVPALPEGQVALGAAEDSPSKKRKKLLIVDVGANETEEEALARQQAQGGASEVGVPAPKEAAEDVREAIVGEPPTEQLAVSEDPVPARVSEGATAEAAQAAAEALALAEASPPEKEKKELKKLPYIVVIIDELADLMMVASREVETYVARLAQMARAAGIHLMVATQRPSTDVVTGVIKANFPTRISFMLRSKPDSMTILGTIGAEALLGMGDMLILPPTSSNLQRVHGAYVSEDEINRVVNHLKAQGKPVYDDNILKPRDEEVEDGGGEDELSDELYDQALATVSEMKAVSISMLQRKMRIGYNRAARMIERMERDGVVGPADGARPREVLIRQVGEMPGAGAM